MQTGGLKKINLQGFERVGRLVSYTAASYNLPRIQPLWEHFAKPAKRGRKGLTLNPASCYGW